MKKYRQIEGRSALLSLNVNKVSRIFLVSKKIVIKLIKIEHYLLSQMNYRLEELAFLSIFDKRRHRFWPQKPSKIHWDIELESMSIRLSRWLFDKSPRIWCSNPSHKLDKSHFALTKLNRRRRERWIWSMQNRLLKANWLENKWDLRVRPKREFLHWF